MSKAFSYAFSSALGTWWFLFGAVVVGLIAWVAFGSAPAWLWISTAVTLLGLLVFEFFVSMKSAKLRDREAHERSLVTAVIERLTDAVITYDENFSITTMNSAAERMFGINRVEVESKRIDPSFAKKSVFRTLAQVIFPSLAPSATQISDPGAWPNVVRITLEDPRRQLLLTTDRFPSNGGFIKIAHDETSEQSAIQTKEDFISVAAHQLRTPLTAIHWALEEIVKEAKEAGSNQILATAEEGLKTSERSLKLANDLLDAAKVEEGRSLNPIETFNIKEIITAAVEEQRSAAERYGVSVAVDAADIRVTGDKSSIAMAIFNFIDNAIRYNTRNGKVDVSVVDAGDAARVTITDTGIGMSPEDLNRVFEKLHRGANAIQAEPNGSGLGMYIAKNIIERNGGQIGVTSIPNRGTTVWCTIPKAHA